MKHDAPRLTEAAPHWRAGLEGQLLLPYCKACARYHWPPRGACPHCAGADLAWRPCSGSGRLVTYSVVHRPADPALKGDVPYVVAIVELDEGPRLFTNIVGAEGVRLQCGLRVVCRFEPTGSPEAAVAVFTPA